MIRRWRKSSLRLAPGNPEFANPGELQTRYRFGLVVRRREARDVTRVSWEIEPELPLEVARTRVDSRPAHIGTASLETKDDDIAVLLDLQGQQLIFEGIT